MANSTNNSMQEFDDFLADNPTFFEDMTFDDHGLTTDTDTDPLNPADLSMTDGFSTLNNFSAPEEMTLPVPMPTPMMAQPQVANTATGPCYHPMVGWYYPTTQPANVSPPPPAMIPVVGMNAVTSVPPSLPTSGMSTPFPAAVPNSTSTPQPQLTPRASPKRKYGPSAYLDARAAGRTSIGTDEANYFASNAARREGRGEAAKNDSFDDTFRRAKTRPSIVQSCVCANHEAERIKRPKNAFILYRIAKSEEIRKKTGTNFNPDVSRSAGVMWKAEPDSVKQHYYELAEKEKQRHKAKHPNYVYRPGGPARSKFGTKDCTCGAYELNVSRALEKRKNVRARSAELRNNDRKLSADGDNVADDTYKPVSRTCPQGPTPMAVMMAPPANLDIASFGLPNNQAAEAAALYAGMKRKHDLAIATDHANPATETPRKRRSARSTAGQVNYHEPDEDEMPFDLDNVTVDDLFDFGASCKTPSSTAVEHFNSGISPKNLRSGRQSSLRSNASNNGNGSVSSPLFVTSPVAKSPRSRSLGREGSSSVLTPIEELLTTSKAGNIETPTRDDEGEEDGDDDTIVINMRRSTRAASKVSEPSARSSRSAMSENGAVRRSTRRSGDE